MAVVCDKRGHFPGVQNCDHVWSRLTAQGTVPRWELSFHAIFPRDISMGQFLTYKPYQYPIFSCWGPSCQTVRARRKPRAKRGLNACVRLSAVSPISFTCRLLYRHVLQPLLPMYRIVRWRMWSRQPTPLGIRIHRVGSNVLSATNI